jgi:NADH dehydrogenase
MRHSEQHLDHPSVLSTEASVADNSTSKSHYAELIIAGGGFAGVRLARLLARNGPRVDAAGRPVRITLIDRQRAFTYTPLLYEVAAAKIAPEHAATPYTDLLWDGAVTVRQAEITAIDLEHRILRTDTGDVPYDRLVLALGATSTLPKAAGAHAGTSNGLAAHALPFMHLADAQAIRARLTARFRAAQRQRLPGDLTVVIAGGGAKGVELVFDLADFLTRRLAPACGLPPEEVRLAVVDGEQRLMNELSPAYDAAARAAMQRRGIRLLQPAFVVGATDDAVSLTGQRFITARTLIWTAGITAHPLLKALGVPLRDNGVVVSGALQLPGHPEVYVAGDCVRQDDGDGRRVPATASLAQQHGRFLAQALAADFAGASPPSFTYVPRGNIIKLGDRNAIAEIGSGPDATRFTGRAAHALRGAFDLIEIPGMTQRLGVLGDTLRRK